MTFNFNPARLELLASELGDDSESVRIDEDAVKRIQSPELQRRLASIKMASRLVAIATATGSLSKGITNESLINASRDFSDRIAYYMEMGMNALGVEKTDREYASARLSMSRIAVDWAFTEWQWASVFDRPIFPLTPTLLPSLLQAAAQHMPERYTPSDDDELTLAMAKRIALLSCSVPLCAAHNYYDFFHKSPNDLLRIGLSAIAREAEGMLVRINCMRETDYMQRALIQRCYNTSCGLFIESHKHVAALVDTEIMQLSPDDQAAQALFWEGIGGMSFDRVLIQHKQAMAISLDMTANVLALYEQNATIDDTGIMDGLE